MGEILTTLLIITGLLVVSWACKVFHSIWWKPVKLEKQLRKQGFKGPQYKLLIGNFKEIGTARKEAQSKPMERSHDILSRVYPFLDQTVQRYGKRSFIWYGTIPRVNILEPDLVRDIFSNKFGHVGKIKPHPLGKLLATGIVTYEGEKWVKNRRIIKPAFHLEKLKMMLPAFDVSCSEMIRKWENLIMKNPCELDLWPEFQKLTGDAISRTAFGSSFEEGQRIFELQTEQAALVMPLFESLYIPGFRFFPTKRNNRIKEIEREIRDLLGDMIKKREKAMRAGQVHNGDLLGILMESNFKEMKDNVNKNSVGMSINDVIEECKLFYIAGQETTSTLLTWTMIVLSMHPEWQEKAREEVSEVFGKKKPDFDGLNNLKIVAMVLLEVLRLYPPVGMIARATYKSMNLGDVCLPPGVEIALPVLLIHHSHELWGEDAEEFNPERFAGGISKATKNQLSFFPFGWGPRICIGQTFALIEAKMALTMILQRFSFELSSTYVHAPYNVVTLQPQYGAQLVLHKL